MGEVHAVWGDCGGVDFRPGCGFAGRAVLVVRGSPEVDGGGAEWQRFGEGLLGCLRRGRSEAWGVRVCGGGAERRLCRAFDDAEVAEAVEIVERDWIGA